MLGLGLGMGVGNKAPLLPVSAFPSVADIPPGMVVLDSDGAVKKKVKVMKNEGSDYVTLGRPPWVNQVRPGVDIFSFGVTATASTLFEQAFIGGMSSFGSQRQLYIGCIASGQIVVYVGGAVYYVPGFTITANKFFNVTVNVNLTTADVFIDSVQRGTFAIGTSVYPQDIIIGARSDNSLNMEGLVAVAFFGRIETIDFNKWDGSDYGIGNNGTQYTVIKATPLSEETYALVPVSLLT